MNRTVATSDVGPVRNSIPVVALLLLGCAGNEPGSGGLSGASVSGGSGQGTEGGAGSTSGAAGSDTGTEPSPSDSEGESTSGTTGSGTTTLGEVETGTGSTGGATTGSTSAMTGAGETTGGAEGDAGTDTGETVEPGPAHVLLLTDAGDDTAVELALVRGGHEVTNAGLYYRWDGLDPALEDVDVVVFMEGENHGYGLETGVDELLREFVDAGGSVIRTEWSAYEIRANPSTPFDGMIPVVGSGSFVYERPWSFVDPADPIAKGVQDGFSPVDSGCSDVEAKPDATVLAWTQDCGPLVSYRTFDGGGTLLHINDDFGGDRNAPIDENVGRVLANAVHMLVDGDP